MNNEITTKDLINNRLSKDDAKKLFEEAEEEIKIIKWGGKRKGAGRKPKTGEVLEFRVRLSEKEKQFIDYAREHHLDYDELMQG